MSQDNPEQDDLGISDAHEQGQDSLERAAAAGPPIDWDDQDQEPDGPSQTAAVDQADPLHSIYGQPPGADHPGG